MWSDAGCVEAFEYEFSMGDFVHDVVLSAWNSARWLVCAPATAVMHNSSDTMTPPRPFRRVD